MRPKKYNKHLSEIPKKFNPSWCTIMDEFALIPKP